MKKILIFISVLVLSWLQTFATDVDTQIIDELNKWTVEELNVDFKLKTFESCSNLESVMETYIKDYYTVNKDRYNQPILYRNFWMVDDGMMLESLSDESADTVTSQAKSVASPVAEESAGGNSDFSKTNSQVDWVDESDIIKTDGKYVYYYNATKKYIYIIEAYGTDSMKILKQIKLPTTFSQPVLYIGNNKLTILASGYSQTNYAKRGYYINRSSKTYTIVYDITDKTAPKLEKLYVNDGELRKSRKIGNYLYVISNNNFSIPFYNFKSVDDIDVNINNIIPKKLEISKVSNSDNQNLKIKGKSLPFNIKAWNVAKCSDIEYSLPDQETLKKFDFNPSYNIISVINIEDPTAEVKTKVVAGNNSEIYMSLENLYLTERMYQTQNFSCPRGAACIMPMYWGWTNNTVVHKMNIQANDLKYQTSTLLPWSPLTQYSMDENDENFRIITSTNNWWANREQHTDLFILDKDLKLLSNLSNLWENENFKSSRFMWDKLYLVTFKQVDPLYAIDLADANNPEVLGELKIPGYSEYLHPYDENHLIGLWRDTFELNGWTRNGGLKLDLYEINFDKKCWDAGLSADEIEKCDNWDYKWILVKQKFTKTFWDQGSYSEANNDPRMFMWNADKKLLFLPATLYTKFNQTDYRNKDFFQWLLTLSIDKDSGISEKYRVSHIDNAVIEEERVKECSKYSWTTSNSEPECHELIGWGEVCDVQQKRQYVPTYCYADSTVWEYLANRGWNYKSQYINRALWIWDDVYTISDSEIGKIDMLTWTVKDYVEMK